MNKLNEKKATEVIAGLLLTILSEDIITKEDVDRIFNYAFDNE